MIMAACAGSVETVVETTDVFVTVVVTATPEPTVQPTPTIEPVVLPSPTVAPTSTAEPTAAPAPTATPWVVDRTVTVIETVEVPVTVVITATPTPTPTPTPTITPTPTVTPVPTATPIPPFVQTSSGTGSWLSDTFNFWDERPIEIDITVSGTGLFSLNAVTPNGCVVNLSIGAAPYTATTLAVPSAPDICDGLNEFGNGTRLTVVAGGSVSWAVELTQYSQPVAQNAPITTTVTGQKIFGPIRIGQGELLQMNSIGDSPLKLDVYSIYESEPVVSRVIDVPGAAHGTWPLRFPLGVYMIAVTTDPNREWTVEIYHP